MPLTCAVSGTPVGQQIGRVYWDDAPAPARGLARGLIMCRWATPRRTRRGRLRWTPVSSGSRCCDGCGAAKSWFLSAGDSTPGFLPVWWVTFQPHHQRSPPSSVAASAPLASRRDTDSSPPSEEKSSPSGRQAGSAPAGGRQRAPQHLTLSPHAVKNSGKAPSAAGCSQRSLGECLLESEPPWRSQVRPVAGAREGKSAGRIGRCRQA